MKLLFAGTPSVAVPTLHGLLAAGHDVVAVLTRPDAPRGRRRVLTPSDVAVAADALGIPIVKANRIDAALSEHLAASGAELGVVVAYGALLNEVALQSLPLGWINLHFSLLPRGRGAAPVQDSLLAQEPCGVTVFQLDRGMDTGPVWAQLECPAGSDETAGMLLARFATLGVGPVLDTIEAISRGDAPREQVGSASVARKLSASDGILHSAQSARQAYARFRAVTPEPGAVLFDGDQRIKVLDARLATEALTPGSFDTVGQRILTGFAEGSLELLSVQPAGKSAMTAAEWWRGRR